MANQGPNPSVHHFQQQMPMPGVRNPRLMPPRLSTGVNTPYPQSQQGEMPSSPAGYDSPQPMSAPPVPYGATPLMQMPQAPTPLAYRPGTPPVQQLQQAHLHQTQPNQQIPPYPPAPRSGSVPGPGPGPGRQSLYQNQQQYSSSSLPPVPPHKAPIQHHQPHPPHPQHPQTHQPHHQAVHKPNHVPTPVAVPPVPAGVREQIAQQVRHRASAPLITTHDKSSSVSSGGSAGNDATPLTPIGMSRSSMFSSPTDQSPRVMSGDTAKPMPRRQYGHHSSGNSGDFGNGITIVKPPHRDIDVESFETIRRHAASQPHNPDIQLDLAKKLCEAAQVLASRYTDPANPSTMRVDPRQEARNKEAWIAQALKITKRLATKSMHPNAMFYLGSSYSSGQMGLEIDEQKALEFYNRAAKLDHPEACYRIAVCHEFGVGARRDYEKALSWYKKSAHLGSVSSMYKLGMLSLQEQRPGASPRNFQEGLTWLQRAAAKADSYSPHAVHELALLYERAPTSSYREGDALPKNDSKALELYYQAAKLGYAPSQSRLGRSYEFGELGCGIDSTRSVSWYMSAAQQGDADAELGMCGWYWTGTGTDRTLRQSDTEAFLWAERAANKGHTRALFAVGYFYELGIGVPRDLKRAHDFYTKAAERRHPRAIERLRELNARSKRYQV